jgi:DNA-binding NarL/FixJ family response regulator
MLRPILALQSQMGRVGDSTGLRRPPVKSLSPKQLRDGEFLAKSLQWAIARSAFIQSPVRIREVAMMNLDEIKITPRDEDVLKLLVQGCAIRKSPVN